MEMSKDIFLNQLKTYIPADDYIMVGNIKGVSGPSDDEGAANLAGWRFIKESDFRNSLTGVAYIGSMKCFLSGDVGESFRPEPFQRSTSNRSSKKLPKAC
jgi:hypothetical protein